MKTILFLFLNFCISYQCVSQWNPQSSNTTQHLIGISAINNNVVWACGDSGTVLRTINGGNNWQNVSNNQIASDFQLLNICAIDQNTALVHGTHGFFFLSNNNSVFKTTNGGINWSSVFTKSDQHIYSLDIDQNGTGILIAQTKDTLWSLWKTNNYGNTWDSINSFPFSNNKELGHFKSLYVKDSVYIFGTNNNRFYKTTNASQNWELIPIPSKISSFICFNDNQSEGFVCGDSLYKTTNSGVNWIYIKTPNEGSGTIWGVLRDINTYCMFRGSSGIIYKSTNSGANWNWLYFSSFLWGFSQANQGGSLWAVGGYGSIYRSNELVNINHLATNIPSEFQLSQNYPNPFNPTTNIKFNITKTDFVQLIVYDITGKEVAVLVDQRLLAGEYEYQFDGTGLSSGIYFYRIQTKAFVDIKKMILVK